MSTTTTAEKPIEKVDVKDMDTTQLHSALTKLAKARQSVEGDDLDDVFDERERKLQRQLKSLTSADRKDLQDEITGVEETDGLNVKIVTEDDYQQALHGKTSDPRAEKLMKAAKAAGVELTQGEVVVIKKGSGVDVSVSDSLSKKFKAELVKLGPGFRVMASRGKVTSGTRGDLSELAVGTILRKKYKETTYEAKVIERDGKRLILGTQGAEIKGKEFTSLSAPGMAITSYSVRGPEWWEFIPPDSDEAPTNGQKN